MKNTVENSLSQLPVLQGSTIPELCSFYPQPDALPVLQEPASYTNWIRTLALIFFIVGLLVISSTLSFEIWQLNPGITQENASLELTQGGLLLLAALIQCTRAFSQYDSSLQRDICLGLALFTFMLFLREVDIDQLGMSALWSTLENTLRILALIAVLFFVTHMIRRIKIIRGSLNKIFRAPIVNITIVGCLLYACGWPFDKELLNVDKGLSLWIEETFELNACLLFFCASLISNIKKDPTKIQAPSF